MTKPEKLWRSKRDKKGREIHLSTANRRKRGIREVFVLKIKGARERLKRADSHQPIKLTKTLAPSIC